MPNEIFKEAMGDWVYGCDVCQDSCPMNKNKWIGNEEFPNLEELSSKISLEKIIKMDYDFLENVLQKKFWYIPKDDVWKWKVNAINAMINNYKEEYKASIYEALEDSNQKVREMADFVIKKLSI
ncbi:Epoxyqueuosine reductase [compost metagenome]